MGKKAPTPKPVSPDDKTPEEVTVEHKRRASELLLATNREAASAQYLAAQRAENAYKAKKRSEGARQHRKDAASHFKQSITHFKEGVKSTLSMFASIPWMFSAWKENRRNKSEKKSVERLMEKKKKMEEQIAKQEAASKQEKEQES